MIIRISGEMEQTREEELTAEAAAYLTGLFKLSHILKPHFEERIPDPAFLLTSNGNSFFSYLEADPTRLGEMQPAMCCQVICPRKGSCWIAPRVIEFEASRGDIEVDERGTVFGIFGFHSGDLADVEGMIKRRFLSLLKGMLFAGAWGGPQDLWERPMLTAPQKEMFLLDK